MSKYLDAIHGRINPHAMRLRGTEETFCGHKVYYLLGTEEQLAAVLGIDDNSKLIANPTPADAPAVDVCPKCGGTDVRMRYCPKKGTTSLCWKSDYNNDGEHMHRNCQRCRYEWLEDCPGNKPVPAATVFAMNTEGDTTIRPGKVLPAPDRIIRNDSTPETAAVWRTVDKAAEHAPETVKRRIEDAPVAGAAKPGMTDIIRISEDLGLYDDEAGAATPGDVDRLKRIAEILVAADDRAVKRGVAANIRSELTPGEEHELWELAGCADFRRVQRLATQGGKDR